ncbi:pilus assembly protein TadG-related protein [Breoghania sp. L-A4]|uniref:pilus assembly protein TadG-related protein n=1 Tax=Breoghania sp. L-A4 TaxID=2304600 RepID=UPI0020C11FAC|nr:pilus assembly protein TadG-related protein [Breoghania sp. L-A4]
MFAPILAKFRKDDRGNIAILFGLTIVPVVFAVGAGIDMSQVVSAKQRAQIAVDSAALAINTQAYASITNDAMTAAARAEFEANFNVRSGTIADFSASRNADGAVNVTAEVSVGTAFTPLVGIDALNFVVQSETIVGDASFDVVMVLDNSGSMGGTKITTLKEAAKDLTATLLAVNATSPVPDRVKIGLVPFTAFVNVGADKADAAWIDVNGLSPVNGNNMATNTPRLDLFNQISGVSWQGCVEARPYPYDVRDTEASDAVPETLFVPEFAPDEPDEGGYIRYDNYRSYSYSNSWIDDDGGTCTTSVSGLGADAHTAKQQRMCKYDGASFSSWDNGVSRGPNYGCKTQQVTPLTTSKDTVDAAIDAMVADGYTNIHQGVMWGWRAISPQAPFTEGRAMNDPANPGHRRIMIVMTDGANTYEWNDRNPNISKYNAYGYVPENRTGIDYNNNGDVTDVMDTRTGEACANAKADGEIEVYTIAFQISDTVTRNMLRDCATTPEMAYQSDSDAELLVAFQNIAKEISKLRLAR